MTWRAGGGVALCVESKSNVKAMTDSIILGRSGVGELGVVCSTIPNGEGELCLACFKKSIVLGGEGEPSDVRSEGTTIIVGEDELGATGIIIVVSAICCMLCD